MRARRHCTIPVSCLSESSYALASFRLDMTSLAAGRRWRHASRDDTHTHT